MNALAAARHPTSFYVKQALLGLLFLAIGFFGWTAFKLWLSWQDFERVEWDLAATLSRVRAVPTEPAPAIPPSDGDAIRSEPVADKLFDSLLVIGSDAREGFGGQRADVIMLFLLPDNGRPAIVSIPRDLYVESPCGGGFTRINANFNGCGDEATGPELMGLAVQEFTGVEIDHVVLFTFDGFEEVIDDVGGITICVDNPVRDFDAKLELPAGCTEASGAQALGWVRTRKTEEFVDDGWRRIPGLNDFSRQRHQQDVIFQLLNRLKGFRSLGELTNTVERLSNAFTVDSELSLPNAVRLAWEIRDLEQSEFAALQLEVTDYVTPAGAQVLRPTKPFREILAEAYPDIDVVEETAGL